MRVGVDLDRLGELAHDGPVVTGDRADAEHATRRSTSSWVSAVFSMLTPTSFGSNDTCVTQLIVMALRRSPCAGPDHVEPGRERPQQPAPQLVVVGLRLVVVADPAGNGPIGPVPPGAATQGPWRS